MSEGVFEKSVQGGKGNLPVSPGYQPGETAKPSVVRKEALGTKVVSPRSGRQVADWDRLVACATHCPNTL